MHSEIKSEDLENKEMKTAKNESNNNSCSTMQLLIIIISQ